MEICVKRIVGTDYESNCYIVYNKSSRQSIIIDPNEYTQIERFVKEERLINKYILLSHEHYDHLAALKETKDRIGGVSMASLGCKMALPNVQALINKTFPIHMNFLGIKGKEVPQFKGGDIDFTFEKVHVLSWSNCNIYLTETLGHSQGSISIYFPNKMIFSGDAFLYGKPFITKMLGGSKELYNSSTLKYYDSLPKDIIVYPGHGEFFKLSEKYK